MAIKSILLPHPRLSVVLLIVWLLLNNRIAPGHIVLGAIIALLIPIITRVLWPQRAQMHRPDLVLKLVGTLLWDIVKANIEVTSRILGSQANLRPRFVRLSLELRSDYAITTLATAISLTPGTVTADIAADRTSLLIHCLHVNNEAALILALKQRYEWPLKEIFE
jgi:multicomponent K+:H+ antiporter subunit E